MGSSLPLLLHFPGTHLLSAHSHGCRTCFCLAVSLGNTLSCWLSGPGMFSVDRYFHDPLCYSLSLQKILSQVPYFFNMNWKRPVQYPAMGRLRREVARFQAWVPKIVLKQANKVRLKLLGGSLLSIIYASIPSVIVCW